MPVGASPRVLVVNDDRRLASSVQGLLASEGYEARTATDGEAALQALTRWPADLVLLDLIMPGLDGWAFLERRAASPTLSQSVVLVWSVAEQDELERARNLGATECLPRMSTTPDTLLAAVSRLLAGRNSTPAHRNSWQTAAVVAVRDITLEGVRRMAWQLDPMHTQVEFATKHFGMMTVRGRFNQVSTTGTVDPAHPEASSIGVTIDVASLNTHNAQRDNDLRGSYFLELEKYPTITFQSTRIDVTDPDHFDMTGDLTIKGITNPVTLRVTRYGELNDPQMGHRVAFSGEGQINRKDFGMAFDMLADGKLIVAHEIKLQIEVEVMEVPEAAAAGTAPGQPATTSAAS